MLLVVSSPSNFNVKCSLWRFDQILYSQATSKPKANKAPGLTAKMTSSHVHGSIFRSVKTRLSAHSHMFWLEPVHYCSHSDSHRSFSLNRTLSTQEPACVWWFVCSDRKMAFLQDAVQSKYLKHGHAERRSYLYFVLIKSHLHQQSCPTIKPARGI